MNIIKYMGVGSAHFSKNLPCQDSAGYRVSENTGNVILADSDGCSGCDFPSQSSDTNVEAIISYFDSGDKKDLKTLFEQESFKQDLIDHIQSRLYKTAAQFQFDNIIEFSATLIFAVRSDDYILTGHVGDGNLVCFSEEGEIVYFSDAENGRTSSHTYFTNDDNLPDHLHLDLIPAENIRNIVLYSDGPQQLFRNKRNNSFNDSIFLMIEKVRNEEITDVEQLADFFHEQTTDHMKLIGDDWSLLLFDLHAQQSNKEQTQPEPMSYLFYRKYALEHPESAEYINDKLVLFTEQIQSLPPMLYEITSNEKAFGRYENSNIINNPDDGAEEVYAALKPYLSETIKKTANEEISSSSSGYEISESTEPDDSGFEEYEDTPPQNNSDYNYYDSDDEDEDEDDMSTVFD